MTFIGVGADVQVAAYTFAFLDRTVRKLCANYMKHHVSATIANRHRELMRQSYYLGAVSTINARLKEQKIQTPVTSGALVLVKDSLIRQAMNEIGNLRTVRTRKSYINTDAYTKGQTDGRQVGIHHGISNGRAEQKTIGK